MILAQGMTLAAAGLIPGAVASPGLSRVLAILPVEVSRLGITNRDALLK